MSKSYIVRDGVSPATLWVLMMLIVPTGLGIGYFWGNDIGYENGYTQAETDLECVDCENATETILIEKSMSNISVSVNFTKDMTINFYDNSSGGYATRSEMTAFSVDESEYLMASIIFGMWVLNSTYIMNLRDDSDYIVNFTEGENSFAEFLLIKTIFTEVNATIIVLNLQLWDSFLMTSFNFEFNFMQLLFLDPYPCLELEVNQTYSIDLKSMHVIIQNPTTATIEIDLLINNSIEYTAYCPQTYTDDWFAYFII